MLAFDRSNSSELAVVATIAPKKTAFMNVVSAIGFFIKQTPWYVFWRKGARETENDKLTLAEVPLRNCTPAGNWRIVLGRDEATQFLSENGWLSNLPLAMRKAFLSGAKQIKVAKDEKVFLVEDDPRFMVGLAEGSVGALVSYNPQESRLITVYAAGSWLGDAAVLTQNVHRGTAIARTDCTCLIVPARHVYAVASQHPEIWRWMAMNVLSQFDSYATITEAALSRDPISRLVIMMLSLWKLNPRQDSYDLSMEEIGQMVGLTRNTVSKCLQELEHAGLVQRSYARLQLQPVERLEAELAKRSAN